MTVERAKLFHDLVRSPATIPVLLAVSAVLASLGGATLSLALRYERDGLVAGELWRLVSGHLVHLDGVHLVLNLAGLLLLSLLLGRFLRPSDWLGSLLVAALMIDAGLYFGSPEVNWYVGLSGVLHGIWAAGCGLALLRRNWAVLPVTLVLVVKLGIEIAGGDSAMPGALLSSPVITEAHAWGAIGGVIWALTVIAIRGRHASL